MGHLGTDSILHPVVLHLHVGVPHNLESSRVAVQDPDEREMILHWVHHIGDVLDGESRSMLAGEVVLEGDAHAREILGGVRQHLRAHVLAGGSGDHELKKRAGDVA